MPLDFEVPEDLWTRQERAPGSALLAFTVAFEQRNIAALHDRLMEIADPQHADYGQWLSKQEVDDLTNPSAEERAGAVRYLTAQLAPTYIKDHGDHVRVVAPVEKIESVFGMEFHVWASLTERQAATGKPRLAIVSPTAYVLPAELADVVMFVSGLTGFPAPKERRLGVLRPLVSVDDTDGKVTPSVVNNVYQIVPTSVPANDNASLCLAEFQNDHSYSPVDLAAFDQQNELPATNVAQIEGSLNYDPADLEATLDVQYGAAIAYDANVWYWSNPGWMYDFTVALLQQPQMPLVVSISWGWTETQQCRITSCNGVSNNQYISSCDANWLKIAARGTTVVASSGDRGAPGDGNPNCINHATPISVMYPSVSPYVLSVGATMLVEPAVQPPPPPQQTPMCTTVGCSQSTTETTCSYPDALITTGGGFSTIEAQPSYQAAAVAAYVANYGAQLPPTSLYNPKLRANPDVAGLGHNYVIIANGEYQVVDGTSCSAPVWGGIISLLNKGLMANGKPPVGFVAPLLYQLAASNSAVFNDITTGNNKCTERCCSQYGYPATPGWDAATGLGTPNFPNLYKAVVG